MGRKWAVPALDCRQVASGQRARRAQFRLRREQAPGPRGSPQDPQAPDDGDGWLASEPLLETANVESWGASFLLLHFGHCAVSLPYTNASNG